MDVFEWLAVRPGILLLAVATFLYLHDLSVLLYANEVLVFRSVGGRWAARTARRYPEFARRHLALVRPWRPDTIALKASWPREVTQDDRQRRRLAAQISTIERSLRPLRHQAAALMLTMFIGLPCVYGFIGPRSFLIGAAVVYGQVAVMSSWLLVKRQALGLPGKSLAFITLESLVCIPYAVNLYRKIATRLLPGDADPLVLADALLDDGPAAVFRQDLVNAVDVYIGVPGAEARKQSRLRRYREQVLDRSTA